MHSSDEADERVSRIAAAIGEPARARMLYCLMGNRARTSTELALIAEVTPSTASTHLHRLKSEGLVKVLVQGKHRYYSLNGADVAAVLEKLSVLAGGTRSLFVPATPDHLRAARRCYDHIAGALGVAIHDRLVASGWLAPEPRSGEDALGVTPGGAAAFAALGIDIEATRRLRRRFAFGCLDWSERRPHIGGAVGAALFATAVEKRWLAQERGSRALRVTPLGRRALGAAFGLRERDFGDAPARQIDRDRARGGHGR